jgi:transposase
MFVRIKTTPNSPRRSVQVVESSRSGGKVSQRIVRYIGIALDDAEEAQMRAMGNEFIERAATEALNAHSLFEVDSKGMRRPGRPARQSLASVAAASSVSLADVAEVSRRVEGPHEVLGHLFDYLRFDRVLADKPGAGRGAAMLRDLVVARSMVCGSKRECARALDVDYGKSYSTDSLYRLMDSVHERLDDLKRIVFEATASLTGGQVDMMLFDVTTLYFESVEVDTLRTFGYSKDQKYHCTQVVLALATNSDGLPIGYELFAGNTAEVKTLIECMRNWAKGLKIERVSFVADRALCSQANLELLEQHKLSYVVAMPLRRSLKAHEQAQVLQTQLAEPHEVDGELVWVREFEWQGRRLIVTYSSKRAHKDQSDRQALIDKLNAKLGKAKREIIDPATGEIKIKASSKANATVKTANAKRLITNSGYLKYIEQADAGGVFVLDEDKLAQDSAWDGLHAIVTSDRTASASQLLARYRRLWVIEDSFRLMKHNLAIRPIYHFKPERIKAHIGICFLSFALIRHAQQRIKLAQQAMSTEDIRRALHSVQASVLAHKKTHAKYRLPSAFSNDAARIYRAFGLKRDLDAAALLD